ncbi:MAG: NAD(+) synthase, partial [bacterium]|nr:NAD(+) synthase [bacterium]
TLPADLLNKDALNFFTLSVESDSGEVKTKRLNKKQVKGIIAATNTKQRTRMMSLYYRADKDNRLVCGTTNKSETIQGFFVQYGDGGVDIEPLAHLYKNQVYQLAEHLEVPREIIERAPSPDTYTFTVSDEEFYFRMPLDTMDYLLYAWENNVEMGNVCRVMELEEAQVKRAYRDFESKFNAGKHMLQFPPTIS